ncbi:SAM-dependent methyltransferase, partial [Frankia sp. EI5c]|uniref:SAM-dependent methyltransferase n=1 Tax=Frankia sp. EI5c TaxID=683316 RepID=UPI001F5BCCDA
MGYPLQGVRESAKEGITSNKQAILEIGAVVTGGDDTRWGTSLGAPGWVPPNVDLKTDVPHSARVYDYILGGKDNFPADRAAGEATAKNMPGVARSM